MLDLLVIRSRCRGLSDLLTDHDCQPMKLHKYEVRLLLSPRGDGDSGSHNLVSSGLLITKALAMVRMDLLYWLLPDVFQQCSLISAASSC